MTFLSTSPLSLHVAPATAFRRCAVGIESPSSMASCWRMVFESENLLACDSRGFVLPGFVFNAQLCVQIRARTEHHATSTAISAAEPGFGAFINIEHRNTANSSSQLFNFGVVGSRSHHVATASSILGNNARSSRIATICSSISGRVSSTSISMTSIFFSVVDRRSLIRFRQRIVRFAQQVDRAQQDEHDGCFAPSISPHRHPMMRLRGHAKADDESMAMREHPKNSCHPKVLS